MGGLMASAAGALSNGAAVSASKLPGAEGASANRAGASSMAEWQISQAEQVAEWWSCAAQPEVESPQAVCAACIPWWLACVGSAAPINFAASASVSAPSW